MSNKMVMFLILLCSLVISTNQRIHKKVNTPYKILQKHLQVQTTNGLVQGKESKTIRLGTTFYSFQGIPFAKTPTGTRRFADPEPADSWKGVLDATREKDLCAQMMTRLGSEDCLYLNVYTTVLPRGNNVSLLPVMIWVHGGAFTDGGALYKLSKPDFILDEKVVYASVQYRLGVFGFLSTGDEVIPGNFGLKDQVMAIKWIHENARAFGGDPKKITVFGESAGGASVSYLAQTPRLYGIMSGVIMQSGSSLAQWSLIRDPKKGAVEYAKLMGVKTQDSTVILNELRKKTLTQLRSFAGIAYSLQFVYNNLVVLSFGPVIEKPHENAVITETTYPLLQSGRFNQIPHLIGFNSEEGKALLIATPAIEMATPLYDSNLKNYVPLDMNIKDNLVQELGRKVKRYYSSQKTNIYNKIRFITDSSFIRPARQQVRLVQRYVPTYYYEFAYEGSVSELPGQRKMPGVPHARELLYIFGKSIDLIVTKEDVKTRLRLVKLWTNFAKFGNPTPQPDPLLDNAIWGKVTNDKSIVYLHIDSKVESRINPHKKDMDFWDDAYKQYGNPPYGTYK